MHVADEFTAEELEVRQRITQDILQEVRETRQRSGVDLFLSYFYNAHFDQPANSAKMRRVRGIPSINFYCNSIYQFANGWPQLPRPQITRGIRSATLVIFYLAVGAKPVWVQMGADPGSTGPMPDIPKSRRRVSWGSVTQIAIAGWLPWLGRKFRWKSTDLDGGRAGSAAKADGEKSHFRVSRSACSIDRPQREVTWL